jgi:hypothetical protein
VLAVNYHGGFGQWAFIWSTDRQARAYSRAE